MSQTTVAGKTFLQKLLDGVEICRQQGAAPRRDLSADVGHRHRAVVYLSSTGNECHLSGHRPGDAQGCNHHSCRQQPADGGGDPLHHRSTIRNFLGFTPVGVILVAMVGVGLAEEAGLINALIRKIVMVAPRKAITFIIVAMGVLSSVASDAGYLVLIPLGAAAFLSLGRHPIAGLAAAFSGVAAVFGVNLIITPIDGVLTEITNDAIHLLNPGYSIYLTANLYFSIVSSILMCVVCTVITERVVEPRLGRIPRRAADRGECGNVGRRGAGLAICGLWADRHPDRDRVACAAAGRAAAKPRDRLADRQLAPDEQPDRPDHAAVSRHRICLRQGRRNDQHDD